MAAHPIVVVDDDGQVRIPEALRDDPRFQNGAKLKLVPIEEATPKVVGDWRRLRGILAHSDFDATEWKRQERERELTHDERKFGTSRPTW